MRGQQPHGFVPVQAELPRSSAHVTSSKPGRTADKAPAPSAVPDHVQVQVTLHVPYGKLPELLRLSGPPDQLDKALQILNNRGLLASPPAVDVRTTAGEVGSSAAACTERKPAAAAATAPLRFEFLDGEVQPMLQRYFEATEYEKLHTFSSC